jgi:replicative DNA helicase
MNLPAHTHGSLARHVSDYVDEAMEETSLRNAYPEMASIRTGIDALDRHVGEALAPGSLVVLVGSSGGGKTALASQMSVAFAHQVPTLVITLEDEARETVKRSLANLSRESVGAIRRGFPGTQVPVSVEAAASHLSGLQLAYLDEPALTVEEIARQIWLWRRQHDGHGVVIVDQLSHISPSTPATRDYCKAKGLPTPPSSGAAEHQQLEWRAHVLKLVAQRLRLTVILCHQLNETHGDGKPGLGSIRSSRGIAHKADLVVAAWRPARVEDPFAGPGQPSTVAAPEGLAYLIGIKGRAVAQFDEEVRWIGGQQRFADIGAEGTDYQPIEAPGERAQEGARKLAELRDRFAARRVQGPTDIAALGMGDDQ